MDNLNTIGSRRDRTAKKILMILLVIVLLAAAVAGTYYWQQQEVKKRDQQVTDLNTQLNAAKKQTQQTPATPVAQTTYLSKKSVSITVFSPESNEKVTSPLGIIGKVPGSWSFEASFPVK